MSLEKLRHKINGHECSTSDEMNFLRDVLREIDSAIESHNALASENAALRTELDRGKKRLAQEIEWGHRNCTAENCTSSGVDCPAGKGE